MSNSISGFEWLIWRNSYPWEYKGRKFHNVLAMESPTAPTMMTMYQWVYSYTIAMAVYPIYSRGHMYM